MKEQNLNQQKQSLENADSSNQGHIQKSFAQYQFVGPLPPPDILSKYEQLMPGIADRLMVLTETEASHRRHLENKSLDAQIEAFNKESSEIRLGQVLAFVIGTITIISGAYTSVHGAEIAGSLIGTGGVIGLVTAFIYGRRGKEKTNR
jgi:uncharacterized membrane protein